MTFKHLASAMQLPRQARTIFTHIETAGSISALDAFTTYQITSATLARRIVDIERAGIVIDRQRKEHPTTGRRYTRYVLAQAA